MKSIIISILSLLYAFTAYCAPDAAQVAGDLRVDGIVFNLDNNNVQTKASPWGFNFSDIYFLTGNVGIGKTNPTARLDVSGDAKIGGNISIAKGATAQIGTSDNNALEIITNGIRAARIDPNSDNPNIAFGFSGNVAQGGGATVSGGGHSNEPNTASGNSSTVGGGNRNAASDYCATVSGGIGNKANGQFGTICGGRFNTAGFDATVCGGWLNSASASETTVSGGEGNTAGPGALTFVGGGLLNTASGLLSTVVGGNFNIAGGNGAFIGGGGGNYGGSGSGNTANGTSSSIVGGENNTAGPGAVTFVGGGSNNTASGSNATVGGGWLNTANGDYSFIGGGDHNLANGHDATVPGGANNSAAGLGSFAAGMRAKANHNNSFVWGGDPNNDTGSSASGSFTVYAPGGIMLYAGAQGAGGCTLLNGTNGWGCASDRNLKDEITPVNTHDVLQKVIALPVATWSFRTSPGILHLGPMAQDFMAAFNLGNNDKIISAMDANGVALAAIQGLNTKFDSTIKKLIMENDVLKTENDALKERLERIEKLLAVIK